MRILRILLLVWAGVAAGQTADPYEKARAAMEQAITQQQASVQRQRDAVRAQAPAGPAGNAFFSLPWSSPAPAVATAASAPDCEPIPEEEMGPMIDEVSQREGLTPDLLRAVIRKESRFVPCAVSPKGAQGLMQLMPATAWQLGVQDPFDPQQNLSAGAKFLGQLLKRYGGDLALTLGAYNAGPARVDALGRVPEFPETLDYVSDILGMVGAPSRRRAAEAGSWPQPPDPVAVSPSR